MRRFFSITFLLTLVTSVVSAQPVATTRADERLEDLLRVQRELLTRAAAAQVQEDVETLRPRLQELVFDWEDYLRTYQEKPEGYIAYSMLLGNPLVDERKRAKALLLKANQLDPNQPVVKNQLGKYLAEEGLPLEALPYFIAAADLAPEEPLYHYQIGQLLGGARDAFLESGEWTVVAIDKAMQDALAEAVRLDPESLPYAYRYAESFYDLEDPPWDEAMAAWQALEARSESPVERQMMRLHQANVLLFQGELDAAESMLLGPLDEVLEGQRARLIARLDRLRNPPPPVVVSELAPEETTAEKEVAPMPEQAVDIPEFTPVDAPDYAPLNISTVLEIHQDATINEATGQSEPGNETEVPDEVETPPTTE